MTQAPCRRSIDMNRKIILPIVAVAILLPVFAMLGLSAEQTEPEPAFKELEIPDTDKTVLIQSSDEVAFTFPERVKNTDLIVEGVVIDAIPLEKRLDPGDKSPWIFTIITVKVDEIYKGAVEESTINVQLYGGETDDMVAVTERHDVQIGDTVIMFVEKYPGSIHGDNYALVGPTSGMYLVEDGIAKHYYDEKSRTVENIREAIKAAQGLDWGIFSIFS